MSLALTESLEANDLPQLIPRSQPPWQGDDAVGVYRQGLLPFLVELTEPEKRSSEVNERHRHTTISSGHNVFKLKRKSMGNMLIQQCYPTKRSRETAPAQLCGQQLRPGDYHETSVDVDSRRSPATKYWHC